MGRAAPLRGLLLLAAAVLLAAPGLARADDRDYLPDSTAWNGLSSLAEEAGELGLRLSLVRQLDWSRMPAGATLLVVHPTVELPLDQVLRFLRGGGRLLLADDFGRGDALLRAFEIEPVRDGSVRARSRHLRNPNLPVALPGPAFHAINEGVTRVITNHPTYFRSRLPTLLGFNRGRQQLLVAGEVEEGRMVALADPSVLINTMMAFPGNRRLARNLLSFLRPAQGSELLLVTGYLRSSGSVEAAPASGAPAAGRLAGEFNRFINELNNFALIEAGIKALALLCGGVALVALFFQLPLPRRDLDGHWARPQGESPNGLDEDALFFGRLRRGAGSAYPAAVLREEVEERLGRLLESPSPIGSVHPRWVVRQVAELAGAEAARACQRLLALLQRVPQPPRASDSPLISGVSPRTLRAIYGQAQTLFDLLDAEQQPSRSRRRNDHANDDG